MEKKVEGKYRKRRRSSLAEHRRRGREVNKNVCLGENFVFLMMPDLMLLYLKINIHQKKKKSPPAACKYTTYLGNIFPHF